MSTPIIISKDFPLKKIQSVIQQITDAQVERDRLKGIDNSVSVETLAYLRGYVYGAIKANLDCLPKVYFDQQYVYEQSLNKFIKEKIKSYVSSVAHLDYSAFPNSNPDTMYWGFSQVVCGFGYDGRFSEENFAKYFPQGANHFMRGFSEGYDLVFYTMADTAGIKTDKINPKEQGIGKNIGFFTNPDKYDYRLDGNFLFPFTCPLGWSSPTNESEDRLPLSDVIIGTYREVNNHVYNLLEAREINNFIECSLILDF